MQSQVQGLKAGRFQVRVKLAPAYRASVASWVAHPHRHLAEAQRVVLPLVELRNRRLVIDHDKA